MGIEQKHHYRFEFLKSEFWSNFRIQALARFDGRCHICQVYGLDNDVHHLWYRGSPYETSQHDVRVLCRKCHDAVHEHMQPGKYKSLREAVIAYDLFSTPLKVPRQRKKKKKEKEWIPFHRR